MKAIGGYFELELAQRSSLPFADNAIYLNSGRTAFEYILLSLGHAAKVYLPYYTCDVVINKLRKHNIPFSFYSINTQLEIDKLIDLKADEYIIVNNYFGIKDEYIRSLAARYNGQMIVDNAQALYAKHYPETKAFYSPRKYVGIPDGGIAYCDVVPSITLEQDYSHERCAHLLKRIDVDSQCGYADFKAVSRELSTLPIRTMSKLTRTLLQSIDFESIKQKRRANFEMLHNALGDSNLLNIPHATTFECPMVYPYMTSKQGLREHLLKNNIFVATYWPNVLEWSKDKPSQAKLAEQILPLPIDQRYDKEDTNRIIQTIQTI